MKRIGEHRKLLGVDKTAGLLPSNVDSWRGLGSGGEGEGNQADRTQVYRHLLHNTLMREHDRFDVCADASRVDDYADLR